MQAGFNVSGETKTELICYRNRSVVRQKPKFGRDRNRNGRDTRGKNRTCFTSQKVQMFTEAILILLRLVSKEIYY